MYRKSISTKRKLCVHILQNWVNRLKTVELNVEQISNIALYAGELVLKSGAEVYRVEKTIDKIMELYQVSGDCFVFATGIFLTVKDENGKSITRVKRVKDKKTHLVQLEKVNDFVRELWVKKYTYAQIMIKLQECEKSCVYSFSTLCFSAFVLSYSFAFFFGAVYLECFFSAITAMLAFIIGEKVLKQHMGSFMSHFFLAILITALSALFVRIWPSLRILQLIIGGIMVILPGGMITNAMKDALNGDTVSSSQNIVEAIFIAIAIGAGISIYLFIALRW